MHWQPSQEGNATYDRKKQCIIMECNKRNTNTMVYGFISQLDLLSSYTHSKIKGKTEFICTDKNGQLNLCTVCQLRNKFMMSTHVLGVIIKDVIENYGTAK